MMVYMVIIVMMSVVVSSQFDGWMDLWIWFIQFMDMDVRYLHTHTLYTFNPTFTFFTTHTTPHTLATPYPHTRRCIPTHTHCTLPLTHTFYTHTAHTLHPITGTFYAFCTTPLHTPHTTALAWRLTPVAITPLMLTPGSTYTCPLPHRLRATTTTFCRTLLPFATYHLTGSAYFSTGITFSPFLWSSLIV